MKNNMENNTESTVDSMSSWKENEKERIYKNGVGEEGLWFNIRHLVQQQTKTSGAVNQVVLIIIIV